MPVLSSSVSCVTLKASLSDAADSNLPSDLGAVGMVRSTTSTWSPPSTHACEQSVFTKLAMWPEPRPLPVRPSGRTALTAGVVGFAMLTTYMTEPRSLRLAVVDDDQRVPAEVDVLVLEVGQRESADELRRVGLRDVEHGDAAPAAHVRVVILEVHPGGPAGDVRDELDVARRGERRLDRDAPAGRRHRVRHTDTAATATSDVSLFIHRRRLCIYALP